MKTILIIGITGFLGRNLSKILWHKYRNEFNIIGSGISPNKIGLFKSIRRNWGATERDIPCHCIDIVHDIFYPCDHTLSLFLQTQYQRISCISWFQRGT